MKYKYDVEQRKLVEIEGQVLTNAQKEYFKESKLRDRDGDLVQCFHYTDKEFDAFDPEKISSSQRDMGYCGKGFYFTSSTTFGKGFGEHCLDCFINMKNPLIIEELDDWQKEDLLNYLQNNHPDYGEEFGPSKIELEPEYNEEENCYEYSEDALTIDMLTSDKMHYGYWAEYAEQISGWAQREGYDGILSERNEDNHIREIVVFEPNQIKLASNLYPTKSDNFRDNSEEYFKENIGKLSLQEQKEVAQHIKKQKQQQSEGRKIDRER